MDIELVFPIDNIELDVGYEISFENVSGYLDLSRTTGDLPVERISGNLPISQTEGNLPFERVEGDIPVNRLDGISGVMDEQDAHSVWENA